MNYPKRLPHFLNVRSGRLNELFIVLGLTLFYCISTYAQCPSNVNLTAQTPAIQATGTCGAIPNATVEAGGLYEVALAANRTYTFTVCANDMVNDEARAEVYSGPNVATDFVNPGFVFNTTTRCSEYTYTSTSCIAESLYFAFYNHSCFGLDWSDFTLEIDCTECTLTCGAVQYHTLSQADCFAPAITLTAPTIAGSCVAETDLMYSIDLDNNGLFTDAGEGPFTASTPTPVNMIEPGCYNIQWTADNGTGCMFTAQCKLCIDKTIACNNNVNISNVNPNCETSVSLDELLEGNICDQASPAYVYEMSLDGVNWTSGSLTLTGPGLVSVDIRLLLNGTVLSTSPACATVTIANNSAPMCMATSTQTNLFCSDDESTDPPTFVACGGVGTPTSSDVTIGSCGEATVGLNPVDLTNLLDASPADGCIDGLESFGCIPMPTSPPPAADFELDHIIVRTWTATGSNGISSSCEEYLYVYRPTKASIKFPENPLFLDCGTDLNAAALNAMHPSLVPHYTLPVPSFLGFSSFTPTATGDASITSTSATAASITGNNDMSVNSTTYCYTATENILLTFDWSYASADARGSSVHDPFGYSVNGAFTLLTTTAAVNQTGSGTVALSTGDVFCFVQNTDDADMGAAATDIFNLAVEETVSLVGASASCMWNVVSSDTPLGSACGNTEKLLREWTVVDWCDPSVVCSATITIETVDNEAPVWTCRTDAEEGGRDNALTLEITSSSDCILSVADLSIYAPTATDNCGTTSIASIDVFCSVDSTVFNGAGTPLAATSGTSYDLTKGFYRAEYVARDECGNTGDTCSVYFNVMDVVIPVVSVNSFTVSLDNFGMTKITVDQVENFSSDNCTADADLIKEIKRASDADTEYNDECITLSCTDLDNNNQVLVTLRVTDECGNNHACDATITLRTDPRIDCSALTDPLDVDCNAFTADMQIGDLPSFTAACANMASINISDDVSGLNACGVGTVTRTYTVVVNGVTTSESCTQTLNVTDSTPFAVSFPADETRPCTDMDTFTFGTPTTNEDCETGVLILATVPDVTVDNGETICVTREWTLTNACGFSEVGTSKVTFNNCCPEDLTDQFLIQTLTSNHTDCSDLARPANGIFALIPLATSTIDCSQLTFHLISDNTNPTETFAPIVNPSTGCPSWDILGEAGYRVEIWETADPPTGDCPVFSTILESVECVSTPEVTGSIFNEELLVVEDVMVDLQNSDHPVEMTDDDGAYEFVEVQGGLDYQVIPQKDSNPLNGVTTYDLVLISQHILGLSNLSSPYKLIAADVNADGQITTFDIVQLRQLILYTIVDFPSNTSWRFVDAAYQFPDPTDPWSQSFPEQYEIFDLNQDMVIDFIAIKVGDLNCSAITSNAAPSMLENRLSPNEIVVEDRLIKAGETHSVSFKFSELQELNALQFSLGYNTDKLEVISTNAEHASVNASNFGLNLIEEGVITFAWAQPKAETFEGIFELQIKAKQDLQLSEVLDINSRYTEAAAYDGEGNESGISLYFSDAQGEIKVLSNAFKLYQNSPNPFKGQTTIGFEIPTESSIELSVYDVNGRLVYSKEALFARGYNEWNISEDEVSQTGVLYYQLDSAFGTLTKKMIIIE